MSHYRKGELEDRLTELRELREKNLITEEVSQQMSVMVLEAYATDIREKPQRVQQGMESDMVTLQSQVGNGPVEPWRLHMARAQKVRDSWALMAATKGTLAYHRKRFEQLARGGSLCPAEVIVGLCLLYPPEDDLEVGMHNASCMLFHTPSSDRVLLHNWTIVSQMNEMDQMNWGPIVTYLPYPLFPDDTLGDLNAKVYDAATVYMPLYMGGSNAEREDPFAKLYRLRDQGTGGVSIHGGGTADSGLQAAGTATVQNALEAYARRQNLVLPTATPPAIQRGGKQQQQQQQQQQGKNGQPPLL